MTRLDETAKGVFVISATPFTDDGALDLASTDSMIDFYLEKGVTGITILGIMGEAPKLTAEESRSFVKRVLRRIDGRIPTVVGVSAPGLTPMKELSDFVMGEGAAGVMVAPQPNLKTNEQLVSYYAQVVEAIGGSTPLVLQDYPLTTNVVFSVAVINEIIRQHPSCVMVKHEDWPGLNKITALRAASDSGATRRVSILVGNGGLFLKEEMARGVDGAMTGFAYPEMMVDVVNHYAKGQADRADDLFDAYLPLARYEQQPGIGLSVRKYVMKKRGAIASAAQRKPGPVLNAAEIGEVERLIARQDKRLAELA
ncbi:MAG: dihydrodipicolinate synthase family protein [Beijerinckiaceae bacterium]|nr:dihydrodipicolinate synthase family protein [Beijerinckiaceae bacterium]